MACPTCDHTMHRLGVTAENDYVSVFHCPKCGTVKIDGMSMNPRVDVPKLVERCREFIKDLGDDVKHCRGFFPVDLKKIWYRLGIAEAINKPEDRPK